MGLNIGEIRQKKNLFFGAQCNWGHSCVAHTHIHRHSGSERIYEKTGHSSYYIDEKIISIYHTENVFKLMLL